MLHKSSEWMMFRLFLHLCEDASVKNLTVVPPQVAAELHGENKVQDGFTSSLQPELSFVLASKQTTPWFEINVFPKLQ